MLDDNTFRLLQLLGGFVGGVIATSGFAFALWQYRTSQKWNRIRLANELIEKFFLGEDNRLAVSLLDWSARVVRLPERFQIAAGVAILNHSQKKLWEAFRIENRERDQHTGSMELKKVLLDTDFPIYVELFDSFFEAVSRTHMYVAAGVIRIEELKLLAYWLMKLETASYDGQRIFKPYLMFYEYHEVLELTSLLRTRFGATPPQIGGLP